MGQVEDEQPGHLAPFQGVEDRLHRQPGRQVVGVCHHGQQVDLVVADQSQGRDVHEERRVMLLGQFIELGFQQPERLALGVVVPGKIPLEPFAVLPGERHDRILLGVVLADIDGQVISFFRDRADKKEPNDGDGDQGHEQPGQHHRPELFAAGAVLGPGGPCGPGPPAHVGHAGAPCRLVRPGLVVGRLGGLLGAGGWSAMINLCYGTVLLYRPGTKPSGAVIASGNRVPSLGKTTNCVCGCSLRAVTLTRASSARKSSPRP